MRKFDCIVIGGGPGVYAAAIRASQLGMKTALVEKENMGGVCLNWGCIPTKSLIPNAEVISLLSEGRKYGFEFDKASLKIDYSAAQKRGREVSNKLIKGIGYLMKKNNIDVYSGTGKLAERNRVEIEPKGDIIEGKNIMVATGTSPNRLPAVDRQY